MAIHTLRKKVFFFSTMVLMGFLDLTTTVVGVVMFGAVEANPLFFGFGQNILPLLIGIKSVTTVLIGFLFYKGASIAESFSVNSGISVRFLDLGYFSALTFMIFVVTNNLLTIFRLM
jgi:hypothetical protein